MTRAMLLCAGYGTRLGALSDQRPKPMLPVCDLPILRFGIAQLVAHGVRDLVINVHHRGDVIERELGDGAALGARIQYSPEDVILGTGGGLKRALPLLDPDGADAPFVSMNGKLIFDVDVTGLLAAFARDPEALGMMVVRRVPDAVAWGAVDVRDDDGRARVRDVLGDGAHMFCGVHVTRPSVVARLPDGEACMIRQGYLPWMRAGAAVAAFEHGDGYFAEHSTPARYLESNWALLDGTPLAHPPGPLIGIDPSATIAAGAEVRAPVRIGAGAHVGAGAVVGPHAVVGAGAVVEPGARLERTVVWAGATAAGVLRDAIVTATGVTQA
ncbi:MAG: NDP-sugar synthase [Myxococcales bacterium]|nr:NDP-sugar synthase [Myxococcales bacterium]